MISLFFLSNDLIGIINHELGPTNQLLSLQMPGLICLSTLLSRRFTRNRFQRQKRRQIMLPSASCFDRCNRLRSTAGFIKKQTTCISLFIVFRRKASWNLKKGQKNGWSHQKPSSGEQMLQTQSIFVVNFIEAFPVRGAKFPYFTTINSILK